LGLALVKLCASRRPFAAVDAAILRANMSTARADDLTHEQRRLAAVAAWTLAALARAHQRRLCGEKKTD
jgi:hypothetical protein